MPDDKMAARDVYDDYAQQYRAAYTAFVSTYELRNPRPTEPRRRISNLGVLLMLTVMLAAQVWVSGSRTVREFGEVGLAAFIMLEIGMVVYAFIRTSLNYDKERHADVMRWVSAGLILSFFVLITGNLDATLKGHFDLPPIINLVIQVFIAISAPVLAFINGDVLGMYAARQTHTRKGEMDNYREEVKVWSEGLVKTWNAQKPQWGVKLEVVRQPVHVGTPQLGQPSAVRPLDMDVDGREHGTGQGYSKRTDARTLIWQYLNDNPDAADKPVRELADLIGAGKSTVAEELKKWRSSR